MRKLLRAPNTLSLLTYTDSGLQPIIGFWTDSLLILLYMMKIITSVKVLKKIQPWSSCCSSIRQSKCGCIRACVRACAWAGGGRFHQRVPAVPSSVKLSSIRGSCVSHQLFPSAHLLLMTAT